MVGSPSISDRLYGQFITYDRMYQLSMKAFYKREDKEMDIYVDLYSLLKTLYTHPCSVNAYNAICSAFINLAAHLRSYFLTRHGVYAKIYLVYGDANPTVVRELCPEYNAHYLTRVNSMDVITNMIEENFKLLELLCKYINGVYFIRVDNEEPAAIIGAMQNPYKLSLVYTKDCYAYQLVANPNIAIFRPKKQNMYSNGESMYMDTSYTILKSNLIKNYICRDLGNKWDDSFPADQVNLKLLPMLWAIGGLRDRNIKSTVSFKKVCKDSMAYFNTPDMISMADTLPGLCSYLVYKGYDTKYTDITKALYLPARVHFCSEFSMPFIEASKIDLYDPDEVRYINNNYFKQCPLDLNRL